MQPLQFWYESLGRRLDPTLPGPTSITSISVPTRQLKGIGPLRIGAKDLFYAGSLDHGIVIGSVTLPSTHTLDVVEATGMQRNVTLARYLVHEATFPLITGLVSKANPDDSLMISETPDLVRFCEEGDSFSFNLKRVRSALTLCEGHPWKVISHAMYRHRDLINDPSPLNKSALKKLLDKNPWLSTLLPKLGVTAGSGEFTVMSWYRFEKEAAPK